MTRTFLTVIAVTALLLTAGSVVFAASKAELQESFRKRLPALNELKRDGKVGETYDGWVAPVNERKLDPKDQEVVDDENSDRKALYQMIADEEKTTPDKVGERNALRNYEKGRKGEWFKTRGGTWKQKE